jgi:hypothetical protein
MANRIWDERGPYYDNPDASLPGADTITNNGTAYAIREMPTPSQMAGAMSSSIMVW